MKKKIRHSVIAFASYVRDKFSPVLAEPQSDYFSGSLYFLHES